MKKTAEILLLLVGLVYGCRSTSSQEALVLDGSFAPALEFEISLDNRWARDDEVLRVDHVLRNESPYAVWVCRLGHGRIEVTGRLAPITISPHPTCEDRQVLEPQESMAWVKELDLKRTTCKRSKALVVEAPEAAEHLPPCFGALEITSTVAFHLAPPGKHWPKKWVPVRLSASTSVEVSTSTGEAFGDVPPNK